MPPTTRWPTSSAVPHIPMIWPPGTWYRHPSRYPNSWQGFRTSLICPLCRLILTTSLFNHYSPCWPSPPCGPSTTLHLHLPPPFFTSSHLWSRGWSPFCYPTTTTNTDKVLTTNTCIGSSVSLAFDKTSEFLAILITNAINWKNIRSSYTATSNVTNFLIGMYRISGSYPVIRLSGPFFTIRYPAIRYPVCYLIIRYPAGYHSGIRPDTG